MSTAVPKWNEDRTATLESIVAGLELVTAKVVAEAAESLSTSTRSIASKLRNMNYNVESTAEAAGKTFTEEQEAEITNFLEANPNEFTYAEIATKVCGGENSPKRIQGKILSMELTSLVKETPKVERAKTYTDEEEVKLLALVRAGDFIEDIAAAMGREVNSIRGKILSLSRVHTDISIPKQRSYVSKDTTDALTELGDLSEMTVEAIATSISKTERGVKTMLTHRGIKCADYDGEKRAEKIANKKSEAEA